MYNVNKYFSLEIKMTYFLTFGTVIMMSMSAGSWYAVNDDVMGGKSSGRMTVADEQLRFHGELSLQNNGGFASVRRRVGEDMAGSSGVRLTVRGDGRKYQFRLRQDRNFDGVAWRHEFSTDGSTQVLELKFSDFEPVFRGRPVSSAGPVVPGQITQLGFMIADKTEGAFSLSIIKIEVVR